MPGLPIACDGGLCDTTNGGICGVAHGALGLAEDATLPLALALGALAAAARTRARRTRGQGAAMRSTLLLAVVGFIEPLVTARPASADPPPPVDVVIPEAPPRRYVTIEFNPLPLIIGKVSANLVISPMEHFGLILSPYYASTTTNPIAIFNDAGVATAQLPTQTFRGFGAEIGGRYYSGLGGPRGIFAGPSLLIGSFTATAENGSKTPYLDYGFAIDAGYEMLVADRVALSAGAGIQYTRTSVPIPNQQFPADVYANNRVWPRLLLSAGFAF
jgi:hypothetical protein